MEGNYRKLPEPGLNGNKMDKLHYKEYGEGKHNLHSPKCSKINHVRPCLDFKINFFCGGNGNRTQCYVNPKQEFSTKAHPQPEPLSAVIAQMENSSRTRLLLGGVSSRNA